MFIRICWFIFILCISLETQTTSLFTFNFKGGLPYSESRSVPADKGAINKMTYKELIGTKMAYQMTEEGEVR